MMKVSDYLDEVRTRVRSEYDANLRVMSFDDYLALFTRDPRRQARNSAQYFIDCFHHFGTTPLHSPLGETVRWNLFDAPFDGGRDKLIGQEAAQEAVYRIVKNFTRQRQVNKLVLLHGPNGSAKSSLLACIGRALEAYSKTDEGALYTFNWVFPSKKVGKKRLGFGGEGGVRPEIDSAASYALLDEEDVDARIPGDLRDHPLLLLPIAERRRLLAQTAERFENEAEYHVPELLQSGELSPRNRQIFDLLLSGYQGDISRVLQHVQVERFYVSRRYRRGAVTVEPQLHVDASVRQLTGDRSLSSLPLVLQSTTLFEPLGDLVDAHRGFIEYNDLLKRPIDTFKYLLSTCEKSSVALTNQILHLDIVFLASSNETHLSAFKDYADWASFKGRIELVRVPYIRDFQVEQRIYDEQVTSETVHKRVAPHATFVAALWAVLTRLRKPQADRFPKALRGTVAALTPIQKADLYATGRTPRGLTIDRARLLRQHVKTLAEDTRGEAAYEGQVGASPREMKLVLLNAAQREEYPTLTPLAVLTEIGELCGQRSVYEFLRLEPEGQFHDHESFIQTVRDRWLDLADDELHRACGLVTRDQYDDLFRRYLTHVSHAGRSEKLYNPVTGQLEDADRKFMEDMERHFKVDKTTLDFRSEILGRIGAATAGGKLGPSEYRELFPNLFENLEASYYEAQRPTVRKIATDVLHLFSDDKDHLGSADRRRAEQTYERLKADFGYCEHSTKETLSVLLVERFHE